MIKQLEGIKLEGTVYNPGPQTYEAQLVPRIFRPWAERLVDAANLRAGERVLDVACGTGIVARTAAGRVGPGGTVVGVDINPAMLDVARNLANGSIRYVQSNAQELPFGEAEFDVVFCQQGLQFFTDRAAALREVHRVTTPRGRAVFAVWRGPEHHRIQLDIDRDVIGRYLPAEYLEGSDAPFALGDIEEVRRLFLDAGFSQVHIRTHVSEVRFPSARQMLDGLTGAHAPVAAAIAALAESEREALYADVAKANATYIDDDGVMFPMTGALVVARKLPA
jgi:ubiquinone/menaquinone biosynthesis C-methylase UbiE